jgi:hypothetical protein
MSDVEEKIRCLIALATNAAASEAEARTAAMQAVRLIEKHKLLGNNEPPRRSRSTSDEERLRTENDFLRSQVRGARMHDAMLQTEIAMLRIKVNELEVRLRNGSSPSMPRRQAAPEETRRVENNGRWDQRPDRSQPRKIIRSQYAGTCRRCKEPFEIGDRIAWAAGRGGLHLDCYEAEKEECA